MSEQKGASTQSARHGFNFDEWKELYERDPATFWQKREEVTQAEIRASAQSSQENLRHIQCRADMQVYSAPNPIKGTIQLSKMMHESFEEFRFALNNPITYRKNKEAEAENATTAEPSGKILSITPMKPK